MLMPQRRVAICEVTCSAILTGVIVPRDEVELRRTWVENNVLTYPGESTTGNWAFSGA